MSFEYEATRDISGLIAATGYWSGDNVYFNPEKNKIVILDDTLKVTDFEVLIRKHLKKELKNDIIRIIKEKQNRSKMTFLRIVGKAKLKCHYFINKAPSFVGDEFKRSGIVIWPLIADWLANNFHEENEQREALAERLADDIQSDCQVVNFEKRFYGLHTLTHPWLISSLKNFEKNDVCIERALELFSALAFEKRVKVPQGVTIEKYSERVGGLLDLLRDMGMNIPELNNRSDIMRLGVLSRACALFLGLLNTQRKILLPASIESTVAMSLYPEANCWVSYLHNLDVTVLTSQRSRKTFLYRLLGCSTLRSPADIPSTLAEIIKFVPDSSLTNKTLAPLLRYYAEENKLESFPLKNLNRLKARRDSKPSTYSSEWLLDKGVSVDWLYFSERLRAVNDAGEQVSRAQLRAVIDWAWFERGFQAPKDISARDLRDPHKPNKEDTLYHHIKKRDIEKKWDAWNNVERAFRLVFNAGHLAEEEGQASLLPENPFSYHNNPFKQRRPRSTHRHRIPTNVHEAMINVLFSPDENNRPSFSFVRDTLKWDWFDWKNPKTKSFEKVWCPSRTYLLALLLVLPIRGKQGRWLDRGLMDKKVWDINTRQYVNNEHSLKDWVYPNGKIHSDMYGRASGVFQPTHDVLQEKDPLCIFINTNKTQMWDPERVTGYEIWWPRGDELRAVDIANLAKQAAYLNRPYDILETQYEWVTKYDPSPVPVTFIDSSEDCRSINNNYIDQYPYFTPFFPDLTSIHQRNDGVEYFLPVPKAKLTRLFNALAVHTEEILNEQGTEIVLTEKSSCMSAIKGRKCRYDLHSLRVYGVSNLVEMGVPFHIVQMIVGHMTAAMTLHYNKPSAGSIRQVIMERIACSDVLGDWEDIAEDMLKKKREYFATNPAFDGKAIPNHLLNGDYTGFVQKPGGLCPLGGDACDVGQVNENESAANGKTLTTYGPVNGGCGNCRFFCTTPAHLFQHQMVINDLFIQIRSLGKKQTSIAERLSDLHWEDESDKRISQKIIDLKSQMEDIERLNEPLVREWMNRTHMAMMTIEHLDDYLEFVKEHRHTNGSLILLSSSTSEDLAPHIEFRLEKTGEFELAHQTLLASHLQGGVEQCSELSRKQLREYMDRIMFHEDPSYMLVGIHDEKTRDKVAFLMAETMAVTAGTTAVQDALDNNTGLQLNKRNQQELHSWIQKLFKNAAAQGAGSTLTSLLPPNLYVIDSSKEKEQCV